MIVLALSGPVVSRTLVRTDRPIGLAQEGDLRTCLISRVIEKSGHREPEWIELANVIGNEFETLFPVTVFLKMMHCWNWLQASQLIWRP